MMRSAGIRKSLFRQTQGCHQLSDITKLRPCQQCCMHGLNIDLASGAAMAPDEGCAPPYPVKVEDRRIFVALAGGGCACG